MFLSEGLCSAEYARASQHFAPCPDGCVVKAPVEGSTWHVAQGRAAKFAGDKLESWIDAQHQKAIYLGILAHIEHNEAHSAIVKGQHVYTARGVADYTGVLDRCARAFAEEAKSSKTDRLARAAIKKKQADHLSAVAHAGGLALLLVEFRHEALPIRCAIPWLEVPWIILRSAESIDAASVAQWLIPRDPGGCYLERFHARGPRSMPVAKQWDYPRE